MEQNLIFPKQSNEALLVRRVASSTSYSKNTTQKSHSNKLRKDLERQVRNRNDERSLQVFIRLMKAGRLITDNGSNEEIRPTAPPTSPVPYSCQDVSCNDVINSDYFVKDTPSHHMTAKDNDHITRHESDPTPHLTPRPSVMVNTWVDNSDTDSDAWLVMRGKNIPLQHQDHVRNALAGSRKSQSAPHNKSNTGSHRRTPSRVQIRGHICMDVPSSSQKIRLRRTPTTSMQHDRNLTCKASNSARFKTRYRDPTVKDLENRNHYTNTQRPATANLELTKSLVIKIPHLSKPSR